MKRFYLGQTPRKDTRFQDLAHSKGFVSPSGEWIPYCAVSGCEFGVCTWGSLDRCHLHEMTRVGGQEMERRYNLTHERTLVRIRAEEAEEERTGIDRPGNPMLRAWREVLDDTKTGENK